MPYAVRTEVFEGPFDLLLHLILKQEVELFEVALTPIVDAYLVELERMESLDLDVATEFLLIAATLVELKSRRLLPSLEDVELDEELLRFEERDLLLARLLECKTFKDAARALEARMRAADRSLPRRAGPEEPFRSLAPDPLERVSPSRLLAAALRAMTPRPEPVVSVEHIAPIRASVREAVDWLLGRLPERDRMSFRELVQDAPSKLEAIVRFLAVLELYKQGVLDIEQFATFGDLMLRKLADGESVLDASSLAEWDEDSVPVERGVTVYDDPIREEPGDPTESGEDARRTDEARRIIEAVVMAATEPVEPSLLAQLVELPVARIVELCTALADDYEASRRGFVLVRVAGGYRFQTHPDLAPYVERFVLEGQHSRLSGPAFETLAIIAYKQPLSRGQISAIRGVDVESVLRTLLQRGYVEEVGRDPGPGNAVLYGTTREFLERLGLDSLAELPPLGDFVPGAEVVEVLERGLRVSDPPVVASDDAGSPE